MAFDSQSHVWLATLPQEHFGKDCNLSVRLDGGGTLTIDGKSVDGGHHTFSAVDGGSMYPALVSTGQGRVVAGVIMFTYLPTVQLQGQIDADYSQATVVVSTPAEATSDTLTASAKWHGSTTSGPDKHKHNYRLKFSRNVKLLNLRSDQNWILDAGQVDVFRLRNRVANDLWNDFATKPYYAQSEPQAMTGTRGGAVEVFLNGEYRGVYNLMENMDRKQLRVRPVVQSSALVRGAVWKAKGYATATMYWKDVEPCSNTSNTWESFEAKYPDLSDNDTVNWATLRDAIYFVSHSHSQEFNDEVETYFDLPAVIDNFLFNNLLLALDNMSKNLVWAVYDKESDRRLTPAVWDLDCTAGQRWLLQYNPRFASPQYPIAYGTLLVERLMVLDTDHFRRKVIDRYWQLRQTHFALDNLTARYEHYYELLKGCGADRREQDRWSGDSDLNGAEINFKSELTYICSWLQKRLAYLDRMMTEEKIMSAMNSPTEPAQSTTNTIYSLTGQRMPGSAQQLKPGIYIVNGRKRLVR